MKNQGVRLPLVFFVPRLDKKEENHCQKGLVFDRVKLKFTIFFQLSMEH